MKNIAVLLLLLVGCASPAPVPYSTHDAAGCLAGCPGATYVETSLNGQFCRCWAPNAFQFVFEYDKPAESRERWRSGMRSVAECRGQGLGWEPTDDRSQIRCVKPTSTPAPPRGMLRFAQHQPEPDRNWDVKEKCRQNCHVKHCESWNACTATTGLDRAACEARVNDDEKRCMNSCGST